MYQVVIYNSAGKTVEVAEGFRFAFAAQRHARRRAEALRKGKGSGYDSGYLMKSQAEILPCRDASGQVSGFVVGKDVAEALAASPADDFLTMMDRKTRGCRVAYTVAIEKLGASPAAARSESSPAPAQQHGLSLSPVLERRSS
ncbi:MAG TPA: hypothetical protein VM490_15090 [Armatimonadaceae bacterium]|nr:hypothetical protein [Armatimonadaceae bacterium]